MSEDDHTSNKLKARLRRWESYVQQPITDGPPVPTPKSDAEAKPSADAMPPAAPGEHAPPIPTKPEAPAPSQAVSRELAIRPIVQTAYSPDAHRFIPSERGQTSPVPELRAAPSNSVQVVRLIDTSVRSGTPSIPLVVETKTEFVETVRPTTIEAEPVKPVRVASTRRLSVFVFAARAKPNAESRSNKGRSRETAPRVARADDFSSNRWPFVVCAFFLVAVVTGIYFFVVRL